MAFKENFLPSSLATGLIALEVRSNPNGSKSCWSAVFSRMPQVSVLEPSLILYYVDDHIYLFADNNKI